MPRRPRSILPDIPVHIVQRGNDRQRCFLRPKDYRSYLAALRETSEEYGVSIYAFTLMTNHVHILAKPAYTNSISQMMQQLGRKFVSYFNKEHGRTGTLWEGRYRSSVIFSERYLFACYRYIELNPVRAGIVAAAEDYIWSSYRANALGEQSGLVCPSEEWLALGNSAIERGSQYRKLFAIFGEDQDEEIRVALRKGRAIR